MKHPALARVFAIVLAIISVFMLLDGATGFMEADTQLRERLDGYQRIEDKAAEYTELDAELENSISYEEAFEELEKLLDKHEDDAAQHRTDLATHTATMGGYTLAVDMINDGKQKLAAAKQELESGKSQLAQQEENLNRMLALYEQSKPVLEQAVAALQKFETALVGGAERSGQLAAEWNEVVARKPQHPGTEPAAVENPGEFTEQPPADPGESASEEEKEAYRQALAEYEIRKTEHGAKLEAYNKYLEEKKAYDEQLTAYDAAYAAWQPEAEAKIAEINAWLGSEGTTLAGSVKFMNVILTEIQGKLPGVVDDIAVAEVTVPTVAVDDYSDDSQLAGVTSQLTAFQQQLSAAAAAPTALQGKLNGIEGQIAQGQSAIAAAKTQLAAGETALKKGEQELAHQLEMLWYNMGQLEDESLELEESKERLDEEASFLDKKKLSVDEIKELEQRRRSARIILMQEDGIESRVEAGVQLLDSTEEYLAEGRAQARLGHAMLYLINILAVAGGVFGLLSIPGAFEKFRGRIMLVLPPLLCFLCAVAADVINSLQGHGQMYTALFTAIIALLHLLLVLPRKKAVKAN